MHAKVMAWSARHIHPDPWPAVFGYHEVFHVLIILGCACHFVTVAVVIRARH